MIFSTAAWDRSGKNGSWSLQWKGERTCMTQGCLGPQNDASFEGPMILREDGLFGFPFMKFRNHIWFLIHLEACAKKDINIFLGIHIPIHLLVLEFGPCFEDKQPPK